MNFRTLKNIRKRGVLGSLKRLLLKIRWKVIKLINVEAPRSAYGPSFYRNYHDATFQYYMRGSYGFFLARLLRSIDSPFVFVDIGSNQGLYSILSARNDACFRVYSFEPVKKTFYLLKKNIDINDQANKVKPLNYAVSDEEGQKNIYLSPQHSGAASIEAIRPFSDFETITCCSYVFLNDLIEEGFDIFIKIDTEGHEPTVVDELMKTDFWKKVTRLFFEVDENWYDSAVMIEKLGESGFVEKWRTPTRSHHYDLYMERLT
ncbi:FkbM family methyltransferase [Aidingimonas lacisalsi]|uniref:FkbM family methyltransferase n=1 Tax=Aidingimonas lacisalsi TaxID=2604086 RepID=UPI0011D2BCFE|nr:FkbM family methyltransferase [Aidingimonas lacisalsi]